IELLAIGLGDLGVLDDDDAIWQEDAVFVAIDAVANAAEQLLRAPAALRRRGRAIAFGDTLAYQHALLQAVLRELLVEVEQDLAVPLEERRFEDGVGGALAALGDLGLQQVFEIGGVARRTLETLDPEDIPAEAHAVALSELDAVVLEDSPDV